MPSWLIWVSTVVGLAIAVPVVWRWGRSIVAAVRHPILAHRFPQRPYLVVNPGSAMWRDFGTNQVAGMYWHVTQKGLEPLLFIDAWLRKPVKAEGRVTYVPYSDGTMLTATFDVPRPATFGTPGKTNVSDESAFTGRIACSRITNRLSQAADSAR